MTSRLMLIERARATPMVSLRDGSGTADLPLNLERGKLASSWGSVL